MLCAPLGGAEPLSELIVRFPGLDEVMKFYQRAKFVPVSLGLRTVPKDRSGVYRGDLNVRGIYVVDRSQLHKPGSRRLIKQDYLVVFLDGRKPTYYSGRWADMPRGPARLYFKPIQSFCASEAGVLGQYGCPDGLGHQYAEEDPRLPQEPYFQSAFAQAVTEGRRLEGLS